MNFLGPIRVAQEKASMRLSDAASYLDTKNISTGDIATGIGALVSSESHKHSVRLIMTCSLFFTGPLR